MLCLSPQRCVPQDTSFSSLFHKVLLQMLQWLDSPGAEAGPLRAQLKLFATQYSARRRTSDGEGRWGAALSAPRGLCASMVRALGLWGGT